MLHIVRACAFLALIAAIFGTVMIATGTPGIVIWIGTGCCWLFGIWGVLESPDSKR